MWYNIFMSQSRKDSLVNNEYYHIFSRSIAGYKIFNNHQEYDRMLELINLLKYQDFTYQYSQFRRMSVDDQELVLNKINLKSKQLVIIVAYCLMPTHLHLILRQETDYGITKYMSKVLNSYSKYFNTIHKRTGPLWASRFKNVRVDDDEQLLHLTRYIHLNPCSIGLTNDPKDWDYSSYNEYINPDKNIFCSFNDIIELNPKEYCKFVNDRKDYQQQISLIKNVIIDEYSG